MLNERDSAAMYDSGSEDEHIVRKMRFIAPMLPPAPQGTVPPNASPSPRVTRLSFVLYPLSSFKR